MQLESHSLTLNMHKCVTFYPKIY